MLNHELRDSLVNKKQRRGDKAEEQRPEQMKYSAHYVIQRF
jgi:hypothetical protein